MAMNRRLRFQILERDAFTRQYCGRFPPEVILRVDHIMPSSRGGADASTNLITSCYDCNYGKGSMLIHFPRPVFHVEVKNYYKSVKSVIAAWKEISEATLGKTQPYDYGNALWIKNNTSIDSILKFSRRACREPIDGQCWETFLSLCETEGDEKWLEKQSRQ